MAVHCKLNLRVCLYEVCLRFYFARVFKLRLAVRNWPVFQWFFLFNIKKWGLSEFCPKQRAVLALKKCRKMLNSPVIVLLKKKFSAKEYFVNDFPA